MKTSAGLTDCLNRLQSTIQQLIRVVDALIAVSIDHESAKQVREESKPLPMPTSIVEVLPVMLQALGSSSNTVLQLSFESGLHTRDCYSIARSIVETATNICYIIAEGSNAAERAIRHARQKSYSDLRASFTNRQQHYTSRLFRSSRSVRNCRLRGRNCTIYISNW